MKKDLLKKLAKLGIIIGGALLVLCLICFIIWFAIPFTWEEQLYGAVSRSDAVEIVKETIEYGGFNYAVKWIGGSVTIWRIADICKWIFLGLGLAVFGGGITCLILSRKGGAASEGGASRPAVERPAKAARVAPVNGWKCPCCGRVNAETAMFCTSCGTKKQAEQPAPAAKAAPAVKKEAPAGNKCPVCGRVCPDGALFCTGCGSKLTAAAPAPVKKEEKQVCPVCGAECLPGAKFCVQCGATMK